MQKSVFFHSTGVNDFFPSAASRKIRKCQSAGFPMEIAGNINRIILTAVWPVCIGATVHNSQKSGCILRIKVPCTLPVYRNIRKAFGLIIHSPHFSRSVKNRMVFTESNGFFYEFQKFFILF